MPVTLNDETVDANPQSCPLLGRNDGNARRLDVETVAARAATKVRRTVVTSQIFVGLHLDAVARSRLRKRPKRPPLSIEQILAWADEWFASHGRWPNVNSGLIPGTIDDTWARIDDSLRHGFRGLPRRSKLTLARLLAKRRGVRNSEYPPRLTTGRIVNWAKIHRKRTDRWPTIKSGLIRDAAGETCLAPDMALRKGRRGLPGRSSLARLLARRCGVRNSQQAPRLTTTIILRWADAYYRRIGHDHPGLSLSGDIKTTENPAHVGQRWSVWGRLQRVPFQPADAPPLIWTCPSHMTKLSP